MSKIAQVNKTLFSAFDASLLKYVSRKNVQGVLSAHQISAFDVSVLKYLLHRESKSTRSKFEPFYYSQFGTNEISRPSAYKISLLNYLARSSVRTTRSVTFQDKPMICTYHQTFPERSQEILFCSLMNESSDECTRQKQTLNYGAKHQLVTFG